MCVCAGLHPTTYAWLPNTLYLGCTNGQVLALNPTTASKSRRQVQPAQGPGAVPGAALATSPEGLPGLATPAPCDAPVVATLEYEGRLVEVEALAVNKDCVAVAGHCPIIR